jgi:hypothetical protein
MMWATYASHGDTKGTYQFGQDSGPRRIVFLSLNDRYNRGGAGRLELLDRYLTHLGDRAGNYWFVRTGASRGALTQGLYLFAAWAAMEHVVVAGDPTMLFVVVMSLLALMGLTRSRGGLVEQMQLEVLGLPRRTFIILRIWLLFLGLLSLAMALGDLNVALLTGVAPTMETNKSLLLGCALTGLQIGDYISRTNPTWPSRGLRMRV